MYIIVSLFASLLLKLRAFPWRPTMKYIWQCSILKNVRPLRCRNATIKYIKARLSELAVLKRQTGTLMNCKSIYMQMFFTLLWIKNSEVGLQLFSILCYWLSNFISRFNPALYNLNVDIGVDCCCAFMLACNQKCYLIVSFFISGPSRIVSTGVNQDRQSMTQF